jgi:polyhydroxyalkanoate synthesis repressor PhaR
MTKIIKRYANRKLYDTEQSTYVTLDEIEQMVKDGEEIRIIDNASKDDITHITLAHIIFEQEKSNKGKLPISALRGIIQSGEEFIQKIQSPVNQFRDEFKKRAEVVGEGGKALRDFIDTTQKSIDDMQHRMDERLRDAVDQLTHIPEMRRDTQQLEAKVERLETRMRELERLLARIEPAHDVIASEPLRDIPDPTRRYL